MLSSRLLKPASWLPASLTRVRATSTGTRPKDQIRKQDLKDEPRPLYMDFQATTPMDPRVLDAMLPYQVNFYGNPHSRTHAYGWESESAMETARKQVADLIGADSREIVFTSGATESNNMAIKGVARFYGQKRRHVITTQTEHKCVLDSCRVLESEGFSVTYLPVQSNGLVDLELLERSIRPDTSLVSIMTVNNEIGVKQPIREIGRVCRGRGVFFHTDGAQAVGKIPLNVTENNIDLMSISGHKIYGPKGVGALFVRRRPRVRLEPLQSGGGQERGLRSGTVPTPLAVGLGAACSIAQDEMEVRPGPGLGLGPGPRPRLRPRLRLRPGPKPGTETRDRNPGPRPRLRPGPGTGTETETETETRDRNPGPKPRTETQDRDPDRDPGLRPRLRPGPRLRLRPGTETETQTETGT
ncbi:cysteine desulfurase, mitochondrial [Boleophthalmus pectinirostris]|uniref:cysteine desulfurase, mitochondrial n=1 Tax=Boleophthalmus pectinirostris TaxID=150288 RepID=UPI00242E3098|nr:cysteine desulfurase, mitochondrial [Boleophthalmus pectinirostris]